MRPRETPPKGVLLVSRDRSLKRQVHNCLSAVGIPTSALITLRNGTESLSARARVRSRLIILDDSITNLDGPGLLRTLHQRAPDALVVYLTTHHTAELERTVRQLGVLYYTEKPPDSSLFEKVLASGFASAAKTIGESGTCSKGAWGVH